MNVSRFLEAVNLAVYIQEDGEERIGSLKHSLYLLGGLCHS